MQRIFSVHRLASLVYALCSFHSEQALRTQPSCSFFCLALDCWGIRPFINKWITILWIGMLWFLLNIICRWSAKPTKIYFYILKRFMVLLLRTIFVWHLARLHVYMIKDDKHHTSISFFHRAFTHKTCKYLHRWIYVAVWKFVTGETVLSTFPIFKTTSIEF